MTFSNSNPQFTLYCHPGPNPWKVAFILRELGLSYRIHSVDSNTLEHKKAPYTDLNPNGRMPTLVDHSHNDFTIWESGAMILYIISRYDPTHKLHFVDEDDNARATQWLMFQMSGQGPMWGQLFHFTFKHEEKLPAVQERYRAEVFRTVEVLDTALKRGGGEWLVGGRMSYADLCFVTWIKALGMIESTKVLVGKGEGGEDGVPFKTFFKWWKKMTEMEAWKVVDAEQGKEYSAAFPTGIPAEK